MDDMALVGILRPDTESELVIALAVLEAHGIESFVHGRFFGSLLPGLQIESYNTRTIMVPEELADEAREALAGSLFTEEPPAAPPSMRFWDKVRVVFEAVLLGWFVPGARRSKQ